MQRLVLLLVLIYCSTVTFSQVNKNENIIIPGVEYFQVVSFSNHFMSPPRDALSRFDLGLYGLVELTLNETEIVRNHVSTDEGDYTQTLEDISTYHGFSSDGGSVRLTRAENFTYGYIEYKNETFWIEPAWYYSDDRRSTDEIVIYKQSDVKFVSDHACGVTEVQSRAQTLNHKSRQRSGARTGQCLELELAIASDYSMYTKFNNNITDVLTHNIGVINNVNGDYANAFDDDVTFIIVTQFVSTCETCDPWSSSTDPGTLLYSFTNWGQGGNFGVGFDLGELWTDRDFNGPTVGLAWIDVVCTSVKYHVLQDFSTNANLLRVMTSHEIGHNFGSYHDGNPSPYIMAPYVQNTSVWSPNSLDVISTSIADLAGGCISPCSGGSAPIAQFEADETNICFSNTVQFSDLSANNPSSWYWVFENGNPVTSTDQNPIVTYYENGSHNVTLTVTNAYGTHTAMNDNYIMVDAIPEAYFTFETNNNTVDFEEHAFIPSSIIWDFGDGSSSSNANPTHTYNQVGTYFVQLTSSTDCGAESFGTHVTVGSCQNSISISGNVFSGGYVAGESIVSDANVMAGQQVDFHAPNGVLLQPGFTLPGGAKLVISSSGCNN